VKMVKIYALVDPVTDLPHYVGRTVVPLSKRLGYHMSETACMLRGTTPAKLPRKDKWIYALRQSGKKPRIHLLSLTTQARAAEREGYWMIRLRREGHVLHNVFTPRAIADMSDRVLGAKRPNFKAGG
jgi:hypothetical protein